MTLSPAEAVLLDRLQLGVPLTRRPFADSSLGIGLAESRARDLAGGLIRRGIIRSISGIFNYTRLGYHGTIVAMAVDSPRLEAAASVVSAHPGVSHNYERAHEYNIWFTLVAPRKDDLEEAATGLARRAGARATLVLPAVKVYKMRTFFAAGGPSGKVSEGVSPVEQGKPAAPPVMASAGQDACRFTAVERAVIHGLQEDMPVAEEPFAVLAEARGVGHGQFLSCARDLLARRILRRYAAVVRHTRLGFSVNVMAAFRVQESRADEVGLVLARQADVSHCLMRRPAADWPYILYAMFHLGRGSNWHERVEAVAREAAVDDYAALPTLREFKKERVKYHVS